VSHQDVVQSYFAACSAGDGPAVAAHFTPDAVVFDLNHRPVRGAGAIGTFYATVWLRWGHAEWLVDTFLDGGDAAAIEWTMRGTHEAHPFTVRGSEHYAFAHGRIDQIRQYWIFDQAVLDSALQDYPYADDERFAAPA
jgi:ketosteroid isomerase-like protein